MGVLRESDMKINSGARDEHFWHNKHPRINQLYSGRPLPTGKSYAIDVRRFIWADDFLLRNAIEEANLREKDHDDTALTVQQYICKLLTYTPDSVLGRSEYWLFPAETLMMRRDDCEGGACLIASLLLNILPKKDQWRVRVAAGFVQPSITSSRGGHGYCCYCRESDNEWVAIDWCFAQDPGTPVSQKPLLKTRKPTYGEVWFSFNHLYCWAHADFALTGRIKDAVFSE